MSPSICGAMNRENSYHEFSMKYAALFRHYIPFPRSGCCGGGSDGWERSVATSVRLKKRGTFLTFVSFYSILKNAPKKR